MMDFLSILHLTIIIAVFMIPFFPKHILKYAIYVPTLIALSWVIFGGCVITMNQESIDSESFIHTIFKKFFPKITVKRSEDITTFLIGAITLFAGKKLGNF